MDQKRPAVGRRVQGRVADLGNHGPLDDAVGQELPGDSLHLGPVVGGKLADEPAKVARLAGVMDDRLHVAAGKDYHGAVQARLHAARVTASSTT